MNPSQLFQVSTSESLEWVEPSVVCKNYWKWSLPQKSSWNFLLRFRNSEGWHKARSMKLCVPVAGCMYVGSSLLRKHILVASRKFEISCPFQSVEVQLHKVLWALKSPRNSTGGGSLNKQSKTPKNELYSPEASMIVADVIHLWPFWSAGLGLTGHVANPPRLK